MTMKRGECKNSINPNLHESTNHQDILKNHLDLKQSKSLDWIVSHLPLNTVTFLGKYVSIEVLVNSNPE